VSSEFFLFTVALFSFSIITCAILKISVKDSSYIIALMLCSFTYVFIFGNAIRQGIALSFAFYGFSYLLNQNNKKYYLCILVASLFHSSAFALMLLPILMKIRMRTFIIVFVVSFVLFVLVGVDSLLNMIYVPVISEKISHYLGSDPAVGWSFISVLLLPVLILFFIFCFNVNDGFLKISKLYFCLSLICMFFSFSSIMFDRISAYRFLFEPVVYLSFTSNFRQEYILKKVIVVIAFFYFLIVVFSAPSIHQTLGYS
jgi:transmembrane protein EpsG